MSKNLEVVDLQNSFSVKEPLKDIRVIVLLLIFLTVMITLISSLFIESFFFMIKIHPIDKIPTTLIGLICIVVTIYSLVVTHSSLQKKKEVISYYESHRFGLIIIGLVTFYLAILPIIYYSFAPLILAYYLLWYSFVIKWLSDNFRKSINNIALKFLLVTALASLFLILFSSYDQIILFFKNLSIINFIWQSYLSKPINVELRIVYAILISILVQALYTLCLSSYKKLIINKENKNA